MRRIQIHLDEDVDDRLARRARMSEVSKAALIRSLIDLGLQVDEADPVDALVGTGDGEPADGIDGTLHGDDG